MVYFDFDGTITDVWKRYYQVFSDLSKQNVLSLEDYIREKFNQNNDTLLATKCSMVLPDDYYLRKRVLLETPQYLQLDTLLVSASSLIEFSKRFPIRILTMRRDKKAFFQQIETLGLKEFINNSIVLSPDEGVSKLEYLQKYGIPPIVLVGDSKGEFDVSNNKETEVYLVSTGLQNPKLFPKRSNCHVIGNINDFIDKWKVGD